MQFPSVPAPVELETDRLLLRTWRDEDRAPFAELCGDPEVMRFFPATLNRTQSDASIDSWQTQFAERGWGIWAVEIKASARFIGFVGLSIPKRALPFTPCVEVGWRLAASAWGHGYATEAALRALAFAFDDLRLEEVVSFTALLNARSIAVMERIGMVNANANFEHPAVPEGHPLRPHCLYRITRDQWSRRAPRP